MTFFMTDFGLHGSEVVISIGCAQFHLVAILQIQTGHKITIITIISNLLLLKSQSLSLELYFQPRRVQLNG